MAAGQDTEFTLSTGKLLAIFFVLAAICAAFFSFGFYVGKNSSKEAGAVVMDSATLATASGSGGTKPSASRSQPPPQPQETAPATSSAQETTSPEAAPSDATANSSASAPEMAAPAGGYIVQVAAVSKQQDAEVLVSALRKKQYPVFVVNNQAGSKLFHVQIGPFAQLKDAEEMRSRLTADGYNAILKK